MFKPSPWAMALHRILGGLKPFAEEGEGVGPYWRKNFSIAVFKNVGGRGYKTLGSDKFLLLDSRNRRFSAE